jgi:P3 major capsid protein
MSGTGVRGAAGSGVGQAGGTVTASQANGIARNLITGRAIKMTQNIFSQTINPQNQQQVQIPFRNVGLCLGFWVDFDLSIADPGEGNTYSLTPFGPANVIQQVIVTDLNNNVRIQTSGWHLHFVNSAKKGAPFCVARTNTNYPIAYGDNWVTAFSASPTLTTGEGNFPDVYMRYWVPLAYSDFDLRGSMYMNVVNATAYLQLNITPSAQAFVAAGSDPTLAVYIGTGGTPTTGWGTTCVINVYQVYYDQLPIGQNGAPVLPMIDLSTIYELKNTTYTGMTSGQDFPIPYSNFRDFLSTFAVWDNGGTLDTGANTQAWKLQSANFTNIFNISPNLAAIIARNEIQDDYPDGVYYFPSRNKPISTVQFGNMELVLTPTGTVNAGAALLIGYEDFSLVNTLVGAASLNTG